MDLDRRSILPVRSRRPRQGGVTCHQGGKKNKWLARKFSAQTVVLHSFNHLSTSKADPEFAEKMRAEIRRRLEAVDFEVGETPLGYLNEWSIHVAGDSLAKV